MVSDSGKVTADAEGVVSEAELQVQGELWPLLLALRLTLSPRIHESQNIFPQLSKN